MKDFIGAITNVDQKEDVSLLMFELVNSDVIDDSLFSKSSVVGSVEVAAKAWAFCSAIY
jgi:hypothetical protein